MDVQTLQRIGRALLIISIGIVSLFLFSFILEIVYPMLIAIVLAALLHPLITFLHEKMRLHRIISTCIVLLVICLLFIWIIFFVVNEIIQGSAYLAEQLPAHIHFFTHYLETFVQQRIIPFYESIVSLFSQLHPAQQQAIEENIHLFLNEMAQSLITFVQYLLQKFPTLLSFLPQSLAMIGFISIATFLIAIDFNTYATNVQRLFPKQFRSYMQHVITHIKRAFFGYTKAQIKLVLLTCLLLYIGLVIIDIKHAFTIVMIALITDFLPYVGTGIIFIPWIIYVFLTGHYELTISLSVLYAIVVIVRQIMEPKMVSAHLNLRPLTALFALFIGFQIWGILGMLLAPIVLIFLVGVYQAGTFHVIWMYIMK